MKLSRMFALASVCSLSIAIVSVSAADTKTSSSDAPKTCCVKKGECASKTACSGGVCSASVATAMEKLPKMTYLVGTKETCCPDSAAALAKSADQPVKYKVGKETFDSKEDAMTTLVSKTEAMVEAFTTPSTCKVSGTTTIAGHKSSCSVAAETLAKSVEKATQLVSMKYKVGEEVCSCPLSAKAMAKKAGVSPTYVVGDTETQCEMTARLALAREKYKAALIAVAPEAPASQGSDS